MKEETYNVRKTVFYVVTWCGLKMSLEKKVEVGLVIYKPWFKYLLKLKLL